MKFSALAVLSLVLSSTVFATTRNWTGTTSGNWGDASNWGGVAPVAGDDLVFANATNANGLNNNFTAGMAFHSLAFNSPGTMFSPQGNTINLGAGGITQAAGTTLNNFIPVALTSSQTWNVSTGSGSTGLSFGGPAAIALGANTLTMTGSGSHYFGGNTITGSGGITLSGSLTLTVTGNLNETGPTTAGGGAHLNLSTPAAIACPIVINNGGFLDTTNGFEGFLNAPLTINAGGTYDVFINSASVLSYTKMVVNNSAITLAGNLVVSNNFVSSVGTVFEIINGQGATLTGTFAGLPEGATIAAGGQTFTISYLNNNVTLTTTSAGATATTTSLVSSANPSNSGQTVTFTATVAPAATGTVKFYDGPSLLGSATLDGSSQAAFSTSSMIQGTYYITATYVGDSTHTGSTSSVLTQSVNGIATTTTLGCAPNPSNLGQSVTLTATVSPSDAAGSVDFYDGATKIGTAGVVGGTATFSTGSLSVGSHTMTAQYTGDINHMQSMSPGVSQTVNPAILHGDANGDGQITPADVFYLLNYLFKSGPAPVSGDANGDGKTNAADVFYLINYLFNGGPAPV